MSDVSGSVRFKINPLLSCLLINSTQVACFFCFLCFVSQTQATRQYILKCKAGADEKLSRELLILWC